MMIKENNFRNSKQLGIYQCADSKIPKRPRGRKPKEPCNLHQVINTAFREAPTGGKRRWMGDCTNCGRKRSLNAGIVDFDVPQDLAACWEEARRRDALWLRQ